VTRAGLALAVTGLAAKAAPLGVQYVVGAEAREDGDGEPTVAATMRTGYRLKGRVLRPAMVKVTT